MEERIKTISGATAVLDVFIVQGKKKRDSRLALKEKTSDNHCRHPNAHN